MSKNKFRVVSWHGEADEEDSMVVSQHETLHEAEGQLAALLILDRVCRPVIEEAVDGEAEWKTVIA